MRVRHGAVAVCVLAISCGKSGDSGTQPGPTVASVSVSQDATLVPQATVQLTATPKDASGAALPQKTVTWSSSSATVAGVSATGLVTALAAGTATITATSDGKTGSVTITVHEGGLVGPAGGTVSAFQGAVKMTILAGALSASTAFSVAIPTDAVTDPRIVPGAVYEIGPSGTQFGAGATMTLSYDPTKVRAIDHQANLRLFMKDATGKWVPLNAAGSGSVDATAHTVTGPLPHLTEIAIATTSAVETINSALLATLPTPQPLPGPLNKGSTYQLIALTTDAFNQPVQPQGTPQVTSSDQTKVSVSNVGKASGGFQGVTFSLTGVDLGGASVTVGADGQTMTFTVNVLPAPSMTIAVAPGSLTATQGSPATGTAQLTITKNFTGLVTLSSVPSAPLQVAASFTPTVVPATASSATVSIVVSGSSAPGLYPITILAAATPSGATNTLVATATYTVTVTATTGSLTLSSGDPTRALIAAYVRPTLGSNWNTITCTNNACPFTYDPNATAIQFALVQQRGVGMYENYILSLAGSEVPYLQQWFATETQPTTSLTWSGINLPAGNTFTGFVGSEKKSTTTSPFSLTYNRARLGYQELTGAVTSASGLLRDYSWGAVNITPTTVLPSVDLSQGGIIPELHTFTFSDPLNLGGSLSWTSVRANIDGTGFTERFSLPFTGTTGSFPLTPKASLLADQIQGLLTQSIDPDGSIREVKLFVVDPRDVTLQLGPRINTLTYSQGTSACTTLDYIYARQSAYNVYNKIEGRDLAGAYRLHVLTSGLFNAGSPNVKVQTSDMPASWCQYNQPNNTEFDFTFAGLGFVGATPNPWSALGGFPIGTTIQVGTSVLYKF
jgi:uncharacterized protein YjdB